VFQAAWLRSVLVEICAATLPRIRTEPLFERRRDRAVSPPA